MSAQTFLFDFGADGTPTVMGASPNDPVNAWNNVINAIGTSDTGQLSNIVTTLNVSTTLTLDMIRRFNGANENGTLGSSLYSMNATRDSLYGNTESFNGLTNIFPAFRLTGLSADTAYNFTFYASRTGVGDVRETGYTITGATTMFAALDPANNTDTKVSVEGMEPDAAGEVTIEIAPTENNSNGNHFTYLGVLQIDAIPPQGPLTFTQEPSNVQATEFASVTFSAAVDGPPPYFVQWYSNDVAVPGATAFTFTLPSVTLDMDRSTFFVTVSNLAFGVTSSNALLRVVTDLEPPTLVSASSPGGLVIFLEFSELMDPETTDDPFNYAVIEPDGVSIVAVELQADGLTVALTLDQKIAGRFTVLVWEGVSDLSANSVAADSTISGAVPDLDTQSLLIDFGSTGNTTEFGPSPEDPENYWNNVTTDQGSVDGGMLNNLVTILNATTDISLVVVSRFNGANGNGTTAPAPYATEATRDSLFGNTEPFSGLSDIFPVIKLTGLKTSLTYDLTFYASRTGVSDVRETAYMVAGGNGGTVTLDPANNVDRQVTLPGVIPDEAGEIVISIGPTANNNNGNHFTYLGVLRIDPKLPEIRFTTPVVADGQLTLEWIGPGQLQWAEEVTGPWNDVLPTPSSPYSEPFSAEGEKYYRLSHLP